MRYSRGDTPPMELPDTLQPIPIGQGELSRPAAAPGLVIAAVGAMVPDALEAAKTLEAEGIPCAVVNARFIKPLDEALLAREIGKAKAVITLEENVLAGGFGEAVLHMMARHGLARPARLLGGPDEFVSYGDRADQLAASGLTLPQILETARGLWREVSGALRRRRKRPA